MTALTILASLFTGMGLGYFLASRRLSRPISLAHPSIDRKRSGTVYLVKAPADWERDQWA